MPFAMLAEMLIAAFAPLCGEIDAYSLQIFQPLR